MSYSHGNSSHVLSTFPFKIASLILLILGSLFIPSRVVAADEPSIVIQVVTDPDLAVQTSSVSSVTSADPLPMFTEIFGLYRYPKGNTTPSLPGGGIKMGDEVTDEGKIAIRSDERITFWIRIHGPFMGVENTWQVETFKKDGSYANSSGGLKIRYFINSTSESCFEITQTATGTVLGTDCYGSISDAIIGFSRRPNPLTEPIEFYTVEYKQNDVLEQSDEYLLSDLEILNPNPGGSINSLIDAFGNVVTDIDQIASITAPLKYEVRFAAADGVTPLILRVGSHPTVPVTFRIKSDSVVDGTLETLDGSQGPGTFIDPPLIETSSQTYFAAGIYTVPPEFDSPPSSLPSRKVTIEVEFDMPGHATPATVEKDITLIRTPVVLIHGMWSNPSAWNGLAAVPAFTANKSISRVNWGPAETHIGDNVVAVSRTIQRLTARLRALKVAVTQTDVVTHSAGGVLARSWAQSGGYRRIDNLKKGDYRKLITIGTPHFGSPVSSFVQELIDTSSIVVIVMRRSFDVLNRSMTQGLIEDLNPSGPVITGLRRTPVLSRVWIGQMPVIIPGSDEERMWGLLARMCTLPSVTTTVPACLGIGGAPDAEQLRAQVFAGLPNDGLVSEFSQTGGLFLFNTKSFLPNTQHTRELNSPNFLHDLPIFLDTPNGFDSAGFP